MFQRMPSSRDQLELDLQQLHDQVPRLLRGNEDRDEFWPAFATLADPILEAAGPDDYDWVSAQITGILQSNDITPPEA